MGVSKKLTKSTDRQNPLAAEEINENLSISPSRGNGKAVISFSVPQEIIEAFHVEAARRFGFRKGSKSNLFMAMWKEYQGTKT